MWGNSRILNFENKILNDFKDVLIDYFIEVAVNFFVIAFRFFNENQHEEEYLLAVLRRETKKKLPLNDLDFCLLFIKEK